MSFNLLFIITIKEVWASLYGHFNVQPRSPPAFLLSSAFPLHIVIIAVFLHWVSKLLLCFLAGWLTASKCQPVEPSGPSAETVPRLIRCVWLYGYRTRLLMTAQSTCYWAHAAKQIHVTWVPGEGEITADRASLNELWKCVTERAISERLSQGRLINLAVCVCVCVSW